MAGLGRAMTDPTRTRILLRTKSAWRRCAAVPAQPSPVVARDEPRVYIKVANGELTELVASTGSRLRQLHGIGPSGAARLIGDIGDITRFASRAHFASWNGTAPLDASSGDQNRHRLSRAGNRRINRALHIMAIVRLRHDTEGRRFAVRIRLRSGVM